MRLILLLFCAASTATAAVHPPIDGVDRTGFFNYMRQEFERRRLFVGIVDTVSASSHAAPPVLLPNTVSIGLQADDDDSHPYGFVSRRLAAALRCFDASDADFEHDGSGPEYVLSIDDENAQAIKQVQEGDAVALLQRVAELAGMTREEAANIEFIDCWFLRAPEIMQINVAMGPRHGPRLRSGWIVERYPLGKFYKMPEHTYQSPVYLTNYSYVDGSTGSIIDVVAEEDERGKRLWVPTGRPAFARVNMSTVEIEDITNFTLFRETETGVLITTMAPVLKLAYNISDQGMEERVALDGHHYFVTCDRKQGNPPVWERTRWSEAPINHTVVRTNYGVEMTLGAPDSTLSFYCNSKRATPTGVPELLQLDYVEQSGSVVVPSAERNVTVRTLENIKNAEASAAFNRWITRPEAINVTLTVGAVFDDELKEYVPWTPKPPSVVQPQPLPADVQKKHEKIPLNDDLVFLLVGVSFLAVLTVICAAACVRNRARKSRKAAVQTSDDQAGDRRRKDGHAQVADAERQTGAAEMKDEEVEEPTPSTATVPARTSSFKKSSDEGPTRNNSKKRITFAPRQPSVKTEDLVKMITDEELPSRIDAMVEAGPDGEEEDPQVPSEHAAAATAQAAEVVDETVPTSN